jgi:hypothetical protein
MPREWAARLGTPTGLSGGLSTIGCAKVDLSTTGFVKADLPHEAL